MLTPSWESTRSVEVRPVAIPDQKKDELLEKALRSKGIQKVSLVISGPVPFGLLPAPVREVLLNGGFTCRGRNALGRYLYEYERLSRHGRPLVGGEARSHPRYRLSVSGDYAFSCSCPSCGKSLRGGDGAKCKHLDALSWSLCGGVIDEEALALADHYMEMARAA